MRDITCVTCGTTFRYHGRGNRKYCDPCRPEHHVRYGAKHQRKRKELLPYAIGSACTRCGELIQEGQAVHLDHMDGGGNEDYAGFAHQHCNRVAGAKLANFRSRGIQPAQQIKVDGPRRPPAPGPAPTFTSPGWVWCELSRGWMRASRAW